MSARAFGFATLPLSLLAFGAVSSAQSRPSAELVTRLARIDSAIAQAVRDSQIAGASLLALRDGRPMYERQFGWADREAGVKMHPLVVFRIASQSKAITSAAIMILAEEGRLGLGTVVSRFIPAFARTTVAVKTDTGRAIVPATRPITIRDLLTHTAGYSYGADSLVAPLYAAQKLGPEAGYGGWYTADRDEPICTTMEKVAALPAMAQPGAQWVYGYNTDILGCVVERASGMPLDRFIRTRITGPLGMRDTKFYLDPADRGNLAAVYMSDARNKAVRAPDGARGQGHYVDGPRKSFAGGAGLLSTTRDYARFLEMIRRGGAIDGVRILSPRSIDLMRTNQVGTLYPTSGVGFGLAFDVVERMGASGFRSVGAYGWAGAYATSYWIDPAERLVVVWMVQMLPNRSDIGGRIPQLVYQALVP
ncbi:MAG: beta-lactamase family protein [Gemmatimonadetes bacterium]|nr:beta-lactamase family protein [Gemmatimonadota bacterium]